MTLMPVSKISVLALRSSIGGGSRWMGQRSSATTSPRPSIGSPSRLKTRPSVPLPTGTVDRGTGVEHFHSADHAVGRAQGDAPHAAAAQVLLHFARHLDVHALDLAIDFEGVVNLRQRVFGKLGVERRADDLGHVTDVLSVSSSCVVMLMTCVPWRDSVRSDAFIRVRRRRR